MELFSIRIQRTFQLVSTLLLILYFLFAKLNHVELEDGRQITAYRRIHTYISFF